VDVTNLPRRKSQQWKGGNGRPDRKEGTMGDGDNREDEKEVQQGQKQLKTSAVAVTMQEMRPQYTPRVHGSRMS
jgi:hypothetical protein